MCDPNQYKCRPYLNLYDCIEEALVCDAYEDCYWGDDEIDCKECKPRTFHCENDVCIIKQGRCDGEKQCSDGSDEIGCLFPPGSIAGYAILGLCLCACLLSAIIVSHKIKSRRRRMDRHVREIAAARARSENQQQDDFESLEGNETHPPPCYKDAIDNPAFPHLNRNHDDQLPSYNTVTSENFVQITVPIAKEVEKMKRQMSIQSRSSSIWSTGEDCYDRQHSSSQSSDTTRTEGQISIEDQHEQNDTVT